MSNQNQKENTEVTKTQKTEEQPGNHQQDSNAPVANLKIEQLEERANPVIIC